MIHPTHLPTTLPSRKKTGVYTLISPIYAAIVPFMPLINNLRTQDCYIAPEET